MFAVPNQRQQQPPLLPRQQQLQQQRQQHTMDPLQALSPDVEYLTLWV